MKLSPMSLDVLPHMQDGHAVTVPGRIAQSFSIDHTVPQQTKQLSDPIHRHEPPSSPPHASQDSLHSTTSKQTTLTSIEPVDGRQLTPTSSASRKDSSSPLGPPVASAPTGTLPSYESIPARELQSIASTELPSIPRPHAPYHVDTSVGHKRTADGSIKTSRSSSTASPVERTSRHGRTPSTASRSSQLGELSAQLKTHLAYAKVKMDNGWETRTLKEIETLTSQPASPASGPTGNGRAFLSPRLRGAKSDRAGAYHATGQTIAPCDRPLTAPSRHLNYGHQPDMYARAANLPRTGRGSLAPPVDFSNPRRSPQGAHQVPALATPGSHSNLSASSQSSTRSPYPDTPSLGQDRPISLQTGAQTTMEQDAIETLLFMRSPGNSATFAHSSQGQMSSLPPLGTGAGGVHLTAPRPLAPPMTGHAPGPSTHFRQLPRMDVDSISVAPPQRDIEERVLTSASLSNSQGIDNALDEIRRTAIAERKDTASSDDDEVE